MPLSKKIYKFLKISFVFLSLFALSACNDEKNSEVIEKAHLDKELYHVGILQFRENASLAEIRNSFIDEMRANGYNEEKMIFHFKNAEENEANLVKLASEMLNENYDFIVPIATLPTKTLVDLKGKTPIFFSAVTSPVTARILSSLDRPDKNATGTADPVPVMAIFDFAKILTPKVKKVGIIYSEIETFSFDTFHKTREHAKEKKISYEELAINDDTTHVKEKIEELAKKVDAFFILDNIAVLKNLPLILEIANKKKIPTYATIKSMVIDGALATVAISDEDLGRGTAKMALEYLNGKAIKDIPTKNLAGRDTIINKKTLYSLDLSIPQKVNRFTLIED